MRDDDRLAVLRLLNGEPHSNSPRQFMNQLAVMRRRRRIAQAFSRCFGLARVNAVEGTASPSAIIAITQRRLYGRVEAKRFGGLARPQFRV